jgi:hypothetical protein
MRGIGREPVIYAGRSLDGRQRIVVLACLGVMH